VIYVETDAIVLRAYSIDGMIKLLERVQKDDMKHKKKNVKIVDH
jgi:hypothetical protein